MLGLAARATGQNGDEKPGRRFSAHVACKESGDLPHGASHRSNLALRVPRAGQLLDRAGSLAPATMLRSSSEEAFDAARRRAVVQAAFAEMSGHSDDLLSFEEVRQRLHLSEPAGTAQVLEIPLDKIVGSVGRYQDFNRAFLPRPHLDPERWVRIDQLRGKREMPPIEVFRVGEVYFVKDGNHRVSVARARRQKTIRARVVDIPVRVALEPGTSVDDLILKAEYAEFLDATSLDYAIPDQHIVLTRPGGYSSLLLHIEVHQFYMGLRSRHYPTLPEAACDWYQAVYLPMISRIRSSGILHRFPGRTEADLYLWIAENRARLQMRFPGHGQVHDAVDSFARQHRLPRILRWMRSTKLRPRRKPTKE